MSAGKLGGSSTGQQGGNDPLMTLLFGSNYQSLFGGAQGGGQPQPMAAPGMPQAQPQPSFQTPGFTPPTVPQINFNMPTMPQMPSMDFSNLDTAFGRANQNFVQPTMPQQAQPENTFDFTSFTPSQNIPNISAPSIGTPALRPGMAPTMAPRQQQPMPQMPQQPMPQRPQQPMPQPPQQPSMGTSMLNRAGQRAVDTAVNRGMAGLGTYGAGMMAKAGGGFGTGTYGDYTGGQEMGPTYEEMGYYPEEGLYGGDADAQEGGFYGGGPAPQYDEWSDWSGVQEFNTPYYDLDTSEMDWSSFQPNYNLTSLQSPNFGFDYGSNFNFGGFEQPNWDLDFGGFDFGGGWDW